MHNNALARLVQRGHQLLRDDHLAHQGVNRCSVQLKEVSKHRNGNAVVDVAVGEEVGSQALLLDLPRQHCSYGVGIIEKIPHLGIHLLVDDVVGGLLPVPVPHGLRCSHHVLSHRLRRAHQSLALAAPQLLVVALANHSPASVIFVGAQVRDLDQHGGDQVDALQQLKVDVHVERHLPGLLNLFLLGGTENPLMLPLRKKTLSNQFLAASTELDVKEGVVRILDGSVPEPAEPKLDHGPVVQDLGHRVRVMHRVLEVGHEHQIASLVP